jgi:hypothetical protein
MYLLAPNKKLFLANIFEIATMEKHSIGIVNNFRIIFMILECTICMKR